MKNQESIGRLTSIIYRYSQVHMNNELKKYNIGIGQIYFLKKLSNKDGINQEHLAESLSFSKATSTRAIKKLESEGYVVRKKDKTDKRAYNVFITQKGKKLMNILRNISSDWTDTLLTEFTENEKELFINFLKRTIENASTNKGK
jgi:DNA-binding MarR family transcriptional regulator